MNQAPAITSSTATTFNVGTPGSFGVTTTGYPAVTSFSETGALPGGVTFNQTTGTFSGTPAAGTGQTYPISITATNSVGTTAPQAFTLTVNQAPGFASAGSATVMAGGSISVPITLTGYPAPTLVTAGLPRWLNITTTGPGAALLTEGSHLPPGGIYSFSLIASNGQSPAAIETFTLTVEQAPVLSSIAGDIVTSGQLSSIQIAASGYPVPAWKLDTRGLCPELASFAFHDNGDGTAAFTGIPSSPRGVTTCTLSVSATNDHGTLDSSIAVQVVEPARVTSASTATFCKNPSDCSNATNSFSILTSGVSPLATTINASGVLPGGLAFHDNADGTAVISGTPGPNEGGTYPITITASNGVGQAAIQYLDVVVIELPSWSSVAQSMTAVVQRPTSESFTPTGPTGMHLSKLGTLPGGMRFSVNSDGTATISGTPAAGTGGIYVITLVATYGNVSDVATLTITVDQPSAITSSSIANFAAGAEGTFAVTTTGYPAAALSESGGQLPQGLTFRDNGDGTATIAGTPAAGTGGEYRVIVDADGGVSSQSLLIVVDQSPAVTVPSKRNLVEGISDTIPLSATGYPTPTISLVGQTLPAGFSVVRGSGGAPDAIVGTPARNSSGEYPVFVQAVNRAGQSQIATIELNVVPSAVAPRFTTASSLQLSAGINSTAVVTAEGSPTPSITTSPTASPPPGVTVQDNGDGTATVTMASAVSGAPPVSLSLQAVNGNGAPVVTKLTLEVASAPHLVAPPEPTLTLVTRRSANLVLGVSGTPLPVLTTRSDLPVGVSLREDAVGHWALSGTPAAGSEGTYPVTITATNAVGVISESFSVVVIGAPHFRGPHEALVPASAPFAVTIPLSSSPTPTVSAAWLTAPPGNPSLDAAVSASGTSVVLSGSPITSQGTYLIELRAANGISTTMRFTLTVEVGSAPGFSGPSTLYLKTGTMSHSAITATGSPATVLTETGVLPKGVTFVSGSFDRGRFVGIPTRGARGTYHVMVTASNKFGTTGPQPFTLVVGGAPTYQGLQSIPVVAGQPFSTTLRASGPPAPTSISLSGALPTGLSAVQSPDGTLVISGTATEPAGSSSVLLGATNPFGTMAPVPISFIVGTAPTVAPPTNLSVLLKTAFKASLVTSGTGPISLRVEGRLPEGLSLKEKHGSWVIGGVPARGSTGDYPMVISATSSFGVSSTSFTLHVGMPPRFVGALSGVAVRGSWVNLPVKAAGSPALWIRITSGPLPDGLQLIVDGHGSAALVGAVASTLSPQVVTLELEAGNMLGTTPVVTYVLTIA